MPAFFFAEEEEHGNTQTANCTAMWLCTMFPLEMLHDEFE